jgi:predicted anti-sigma-YlaC factor YlaD
MRVISLRLDGEASQLEVTALERHLTGCPRCREFAADTASLTTLFREAPLAELTRPVVVTSPGRVRKKVVRRAAAGILVAAGLAAVGFGVTAFTESGPKHPSSALGFRDLHEQRQFVRSELIRLEPQAVFRVKTDPRFAGHGLL